MSVFEAVTGLAVRRLTPQQIYTLRARYFALRGKLSPLIRLVYGTFDTKALAHHLEQRIGRNFEILMVHSSFNNLKPMYTEGALDLVQMLISFCGPTRTLAMPAFNFRDDGVGDAPATVAQPLRFDVRRTPSQMGLATEIFRRWKGVRQSRHPIYRVAALGPLAEALTRGHELASSATGSGTPFDVMTKQDTLILGLGKPFEVLTHVHHAEEIMGEDFPVPASSGEGLSMTLIDGTDEIPFVLRQRSLQWPRNMWKLRTIMDRERLREWTFHRVPMFATRAADVTTDLIEAAKRGVTLYEQPSPRA